jgi:hypothetical protein
VEASLDEGPEGCSPKGSEHLPSAFRRYGSGLNGSCDGIEMENGWVFEDAGQRKKAEVVCGGWEKEGGCGNLSSASKVIRSESIPHRENLTTAKVA